ncbi:MAG: hypothetical protein BGO55_03395 [Sphingobacteriales bacterium 50-39]|nr:restriction endonuclease subunit S [Sphingobacteriales bacterium]OJW55599.1 MAG: hypothetical protein BGO55_03395 [Sphingobacteriales bacterium 50-39]
MQAKVGYKYIHEARFKDLSNWSASFILRNQLQYKDSYSLMPIGSLLIRNREKEVLNDSKAYKQVTIKLYGKGVVQRGDEFILGKDIGTKNQFRVSAGQFIMSKIDARNGAFGIVPPELDGAITTQDFLSYNINTNIVVPEFFVLITGTKHFAELCQRASSGTTGRQRVDEKAFLSFKIPVPSILNQGLLVDDFNSKIKKGNELVKNASNIDSDIERLVCSRLGVEKTNQREAKQRFRIIRYKNLERWSISFLNRDSTYNFKNSNYPSRRIKELINRFEGGATPSKSRKDFWNGSINWISPKDMKELFIERSEDKITETGLKKSRLKVYPKGTLLCVFRSGILKHSFPVALTKIEACINQDLKALVPNAEIDSYYLLYYLSVFQKAVLERASKVGVTVESINSNEFLEFPVITPPISIQQKIANEINELLRKKKLFEKRAEELFIEATAYFESQIFLDHGIKVQ